MHAILFQRHIVSQDKVKNLEDKIQKLLKENKDAAAREASLEDELQKSKDANSHLQVRDVPTWLHQLDLALCHQTGRMNEVGVESDRMRARLRRRLWCAVPVKLGANT